MDKQKCSFERFNCMRTCYRQYQYCFQHINEEKDVHISRCSYTSNVTGRKCLKPGLKTVHDKTEYFCAQHLRGRKRSHPADVCNENVKLINERYLPKSDFSLNDLEESQSSLWNPKISRYLPFNNAEKDYLFSDDMKSGIIEFDACTSEELIQSHIQKANRLKSLYEQQLSHCKDSLREAYKDCEDNGSIFSLNTLRQNPNLYKGEDSIKPLIKYQKYSGQELLLYLKAQKLRSKVKTCKKDLETCSYQFKETETCPELVIPLTKFCLKHIPPDILQNLYVKCSALGCMETVPPKGRISDDPQYCCLHHDLKPLDDNLLSLVNEMKKCNEDDRLESLSKKAVSCVMEYILDQVDVILESSKKDSNHLNISDKTCDGESKNPLKEVESEKEKIENVEDLSQKAASKFSDFVNQKTFLLSVTEANSILVQPVNSYSSFDKVGQYNQTKICPVICEKKSTKSGSLFSHVDSVSNIEAGGTVASTTFQTTRLSINKENPQSSQTNNNQSKTTVITAGTMIPPYESPPKFEDLSNDEDLKMNLILSDNITS